MTCEEIHAAGAKALIKYAAAEQIRKLLDAARDEYGAADWDSEDLETETLGLVTGDPE